MADDGLDRSGAEESAIGQDAMSMARMKRDAEELGKTIGSAAAKAFREGAEDTTLPSQRAAVVGEAGEGKTRAGTKIVGGIMQKFIDANFVASEVAGAKGGMIGKTRMLGNIMGGSAAGAIAGGLAIGVSGANMAINASRARFERGREGVLAADRMSVLYQQMTGLNQLGVSSKYRMPLTEYRLGPGGINTLMSMEAATGLSGVQQASSVEALRTMSGYQMSANDAAGMIANLSSAPTVNRMFMMTGTSLIGPGGTQRSAMSVIQNIVRQAGLTNAKTVEDALLPGSVTRARLRSMGVPEEMITQVIQYAKQNITYQKRGGQGMYDPSVKNQRKKMGIEGNFATEVEETQRLESRRDESFYRRQVDDYSRLERQTQSLTRAFGALEDSLSGIVGALGSNRLATSAFQVTTAPLNFMGGDPSHRSGDPAGPTSDASTSVPVYGGSKKTLNEIKTMSSFRNMHPKMQERLLRMMRDNPNVGFGQGTRTDSQQRALFLQRYRKTNKETNSQGQKNVYWDGSYWEHVSGATVAPPGRSMHEVGLAADLTGDTDWVVKNAHRYGLKHFKNVNNEPWHVQPAELPNSRRAYEESGAKWGNEPAGAAPYEPDSDFADSLDGKTSTGHGGEHDSGSTFGNAEPYGLSISQKVSRSIVGANSGQTGGSSGGEVRASGTKVNKQKVDPSLIKRGQLTGEQVALLLYKAGFRGQDIVKGVAISERESHWNSMAYNPKRSTGDDSYGLFQINMLGKMGPWRQKLFGIGSYDSLFDPTTNVQSAKKLYDFRKKAGENPWTDWGGYKGRSETAGTDMPKATRIVNSVDFSGDPMGSASTSRAVSKSETISMVGGATFNISPTINMPAGAGGDMQRIAREIAILVKRELEVELMRSS